MTQAPATPLTARQFMALPEAPEGGKMELVCGEVRRMSPVGRRHGRLQGRLYAAVERFIAESGMQGDIGVEVGYRLRRRPDTVRAPDFSYLSGERLPSAGDEDGYVEGPPTLAVEVTSPADTDLELQQKIDEYLRAGTPRVWIVRPGSASVTVHRPDHTARTFLAGDTLGSSDAAFEVEGFTLKVSDLFR